MEKGVRIMLIFSYSNHFNYGQSDHNKHNCTLIFYADFSSSKNLIIYFNLFAYHLISLSWFNKFTLLIYLFAIGNWNGPFRFVVTSSSSLDLSKDSCSRLDIQD